MAAPVKHIVQQGPTLASLGGVMLRGLSQQVGLRNVAPRSAGLELPGPEHAEVVPPRPAALVRDYVRHVGGDPSTYRKSLPPHLCTQWFFPVGEKTIRGLDYPLFRMVNAGCRYEMKGALPAGVPLRVAARLESIDDDGRRVLIRQRVTTGTVERPELVVAYVTTLTPLGQGGRETEQKKRKKHKAPARVPPDARELAFWRLPADAGLSFALLTGDFNPIHWLRPYARLFGHRGTILHGFATLARAIEGLNRGLFSGDAQRLAWIDGRFTRPLVLPAKVGLYVDGDAVFVGDGPGGPAYLVAAFARVDREDKER